MDINITQVVENLFAPIIKVIYFVIFAASFSVAAAVILFVAVFAIWYRPFTSPLEKLSVFEIRFLPYDFLRWFVYDLRKKHQQKTNTFAQYGFSIFCGKQGAGKTVSMVHYLEEMRKRFPNVKIVTNFSYAHMYKRMESWRDLLEIRNGEDGVIFAIDEIHTEYSSASWKDFPEALLSEISQQRKQRIKIVATAQVFSRVAKPIREQTFSVFMCDTYFGRLTRWREYDAAEFSTGATPYEVRRKTKPMWKHSFVQNNALRECFDTYEKIERMEKLEFIPRAERGIEL